MRLVAKVDIPGKIIRGKSYEVVFEGWTPYYNEKTEIIIRNEENLASRYSKDMFLDIEQSRSEILEKILNV